MASLSTLGELATDLSFRGLVRKPMVENNPAGVGHAAAICFFRAFKPTVHRLSVLVRAISFSCMVS